MPLRYVTSSVEILWERAMDLPFLRLEAAKDVALSCILSELKVRDGLDVVTHGSCLA